MSEHKGPKVAGAFAITAATGAVACAACCVLPLAMPAVAFAGFGSMLAMLSGASIWITALAVIAVTVAWIWVGWQGDYDKRRPTPVRITRAPYPLNG